jgi:hypothetical protein
MSATWKDLAREAIAPDTATDDECSRLLWECSPFPFGTPQQTKKTLRRTWRKGGRTVAGALDYSYRELDRAMRGIRRRK